MQLFIWNRNDQSMDRKLISKYSDNWLLILVNVKVAAGSLGGFLGVSNGCSNGTFEDILTFWNGAPGRSTWNFAVFLQEAPSSNLSRVSPLSSWLIFRRNSNKGDNRRTKGSRRTSKVRLSSTCILQITSCHLTCVKWLYFSARFACAVGATGLP